MIGMRRTGIASKFPINLTKNILLIDTWEASAREETDYQIAKDKLDIGRWLFGSGTSTVELVP